jgi:hypothetical protein
MLHATNLRFLEYFYCAGKKEKNNFNIIIYTHTLSLSSKVGQVDKFHL